MIDLERLKSIASEDWTIERTGCLSVALREDLPKLIAEVESLRALVAIMPCSCGATEGVEVAPCPFALEIHGDETLRAMCGQCRRQAFLDT